MIKYNSDELRNYVAKLTQTEQYYDPNIMQCAFTFICTLFENINWLRQLFSLNVIIHMY